MTGAASRTHSLLAGVAIGGAFLAAAALGGEPGMPDDALTPGAVASTNETEVCAVFAGVTYSQRHRQTTPELKTWVMREYGLTSRRGYEIDHRVPLCLGGADVAANLWPQSYDGEWNAHLKDALEALACRSVCEGKVPLAEAQSWFLGDWRAAYRQRLGR